MHLLTVWITLRLARELCPPTGTSKPVDAGVCGRFGAATARAADAAADARMQRPQRGDWRSAAPGPDAAAGPPRQGTAGRAVAAVEFVARMEYES